MAAPGAAVRDRRDDSEAIVSCPPEALARYFRVLGDPTRVRIVDSLLAGDRTVSELVALTGAPQSRVSNHLACLKWCRVAESERRGRVERVLALARRLAAEHCDHLATCRRIGPDWT
jgi:DNA-binding transcriptional ArsR family regulator